MAFSYLSLRVVENSDFARTWNKLLTELERRTIRVTSPLLLQEGITGGSMISIIRGSLGGIGGGSTPETLTAFAVSDLSIKVRAGTVIWQTTQFKRDESVEIFVPANSTDFKVWLALDDPYDPTGVTFQSGPGGWTGFPFQPGSARKFVLLCTITSDANVITGIDMDIDAGWHGGDLVWPDTGTDATQDFGLKTDGLNVTVRGGIIFWHHLDITVADGTVVAVPASSTWKIWLQMNDQFKVTPTPVITVGNGAAVPANGAGPARQYMELATVVSNATRITSIRRRFQGGTWPSIYGFHI